MLEGLESIQWSTLNHAYGSAEDIPELIRSLTYADDDIRDRTLYTLYSNIWHQGTVYQATAYAVPFLIELLSAPQVTRKYDILIYLAHLAQGNSYLDEHNDELQFTEARDADGFHRQLEQELNYVRRTYLAVRDGMEVYFQLLLNKDEELHTRMAVPYLLSNFTEFHTMLVPRLERILPTENHRLMRSSIVLALRYLQHGHKSFDHLEPYLAPDEDLIVRLCSGMAVAEIAGNQTPLRVIQLLVNIMQNANLVDEDYEQLTWSEGDVISDICKSLMHIGYSRLRSLIPTITEALRRVDFYSAMDCVDALLYIVFDGKPIQVPETLTRHQRLVLQTILDSPTIWRIKLNDGQTMLNGNISNMMRTYNLPENPSAMRDYLRT